MQPVRSQSDNQPDQSSHTWINKGQPRGASTLAPYKDGYTDILDERRRSGEAVFVTRTRSQVPRYKHNDPRTPAEIRRHVLTSDRVKYTIELLSEGNRSTEAMLTKEAEAIVEEMGHELDMKAFRGLLFFITKSFKALFQRVYVNDDGVDKLRKLVRDYPVLLLPTHRSYMDFLLVSYVCYHYELPVPAIAAAMDFKGMKGFGWLLRHCGAFYIQRSFGSDHLYWAIFTEYIQTQLRNGDYPLEFFVEGTRSRTNKSYVPRTGMLAASLESYFKAEVPDVMMVPISISYDRILEESLYAYELLGIPKPKESTSGLLRARSILNEDYGVVHINIADPISIRQFSSARVDRVVHSLEPRYINSLRPDETALISDLAYSVVREHQRHAVISPWALMAAILMQSREGMMLALLVREVDWLKRQAQNLGAHVDWPGDVPSEAVLRYSLKLHHNVVRLQQDGLVVLASPPRPVGARGAGSATSRLVKNEEILLDAASNLVLASYRNALLHVFVRPAIVCVIVNRCREDAMNLDELYRRYEYLARLLAREFVLQPDATRGDFEQAVRALRSSGAVVIVKGQGKEGASEESGSQRDTALASTKLSVQVKRSFNKHTTFFSAMFEPFLLAYWLCCQHLLTLPVDRHGRPLPKRPKELAKDVQALSARLVEESVVRHHEVLSTDLITNGLASLADMGAMYRDRRNSDVWLSPNSGAVTRVAMEIGQYIELPTTPIGCFAERGVGVGGEAAINSKL